MKRTILLLGLSGLITTACTQEKASTDLNKSTVTTAEPVKQDGTDYENNQRERARRMSSRMATEMQFDTATQTRVEQAYLNRQKRVDAVMKKFEYNNESNVKAGGTAPQNEEPGRNSAMLTELKTIDTDTDNVLREILSPVQYKMYETNRTSFWVDNDNAAKPNRQIIKQGDEIKVKLGNIKATAEPGESKVVTPDYESKIEGEKRSFQAKSEDIELKSEPGKFKYKSEN